MMKPGTLPWLLKYELLLMWRSLGKLTRILIAVLVAVGLVYLLGTSAIGLRLFFQIRDSLASQEFPANEFDSFLPAVFLWLVLAVQLLMWTLSLFQAMKQSIEALFERGDLDLLLSSPLRGEVIFSSRVIAIASTIFVSWLPLTVPVVGIGVVVGFPQILATFPTLMCMALLSASTGALLIMGLVRAIGVKRARVAGQIIASLIGASFFLLSQAFIWIDDSWLENAAESEATGPIAADTAQRYITLFSDGGLLNAQNPLLFPARSLVADIPSLLLFVGLSAIAFGLTVKVAYRSFLSGSQQTISHTTRRRRDRIATMRFQTGIVRTLLLKEWRSIWRNPFLVSRTLLQILYLIPATILILNGSFDFDIGPSLSSRVGLISVFFGTSLVAAIATMCIDGEEAADLLASAPVSGDRLRVIKLAAAIAPVWLLMTPIYGWLIARNAERWEWVAIAFIGATISAGAIRLWSAVPRPRADLMKKVSSEQVGDLWLGILAFINAFAWPVAAMGWGAGKFWGWPGFAIGVLTTLAAYARSKTTGSKLGY